MCFSLMEHPLRFSSATSVHFRALPFPKHICMMFTFSWICFLAKYDLFRNLDRVNSASYQILIEAALRTSARIGPKAAAHPPTYHRLVPASWKHWPRFQNHQHLDSNGDTNVWSHCINLNGPIFSQTAFRQLYEYPEGLNSRLWIWSICHFPSAFSLLGQPRGGFLWVLELRIYRLKYQGNSINTDRAKLGEIKIYLHEFNWPPPWAGAPFYPLV